MLGRLNSETAELLMRMNIPVSEAIHSTNKEVTQQQNYNKAQATNTAQEQIDGRQGYEEAIQNSMPQRAKQQPVVAEKKVGRNEPCPCGSGKKYKQCHGK